MFGFRGLGGEPYRPGPAEEAHPDHVDGRGRLCPLPTEVRAG